MADAHAALELSRPPPAGPVIVVAGVGGEHVLQQALPLPPPIATRAAAAWEGTEIHNDGLQAQQEQQEQDAVAHLRQASISRSGTTLQGSVHCGCLGCGFVHSRVDVTGDIGVDKFQESVERRLKAWAQKPGYSSRTSSINSCSSRLGAGWDHAAPGIEMRQGGGPGRVKRVLLWSRSLLLRGLVAEVAGGLERESAAVVNMHEGAERFDPRTEQVFKILQVRGLEEGRVKHVGCQVLHVMSNAVFVRKSH